MIFAMPPLHCRSCHELGIGVQGRTDQIPCLNYLTGSFHLVPLISNATNKGSPMNTHTHIYNTIRSNIILSNTKPKLLRGDPVLGGMECSDSNQTPFSQFVPKTGDRRHHWPPFWMNSTGGFQKWNYQPLPGGMETGKCKIYPDAMGLYRGLIGFILTFDQPQITKIPSQHLLPLVAVHFMPSFHAWNSWSLWTFIQTSSIINGR